MPSYTPSIYHAGLQQNLCNINKINKLILEKKIFKYKVGSNLQKNKLKYNEELHEPSSITYIFIDNLYGMIREKNYLILIKIYIILNL